MSFNKFEDIVAWQKSRLLVVACYQVFRSLKDYSFKDQICRAAVSIMNNIAEGFERRGCKEFSHFLYISKGSCAEVQSMLYLAYDLKYIDEDTFNQLLDQATEISRMIFGLIRSLK